MEMLNNLVKAKYNLENTLHLAHWVARGEKFYPYHLMFADLLEIVSEGTDDLVELGMALGYQPNFDSFGGVSMELEDYSCSYLTELSANMLTSYMAKLFDARNAVAGNEMAVGLLAHIENLATKANKALYIVSATMREN